MNVIRRSLCKSRQIKVHYLLQRLYCTDDLEGGVPLSFWSFEPAEPAQNQPVIIMHGLFGSNHNWTAISKKVACATSRRVLVPDARNHGRSPHTHYMDYSLMSEDIQLLMRREGISQAAIVGHSMGGRTAMALALNKNSAVERLVVVDVAPTRMEAGTFSPEYRQATRRATLKGTSLSTIKHAQEVERILETPSNFPEYVKALLQVRFDGEPTLLKARRSASDQIAWAVENELIRAFLVTNVTEENGIYGWKCNLKAIAANLNHITAFTSFNQQYSGDTLFIGGGNSAYFTKADYPEVYRLFPRAQIVNIDGAGHWVHYDKPHEFMQHLISFLNAPSDQLQST